MNDKQLADWIREQDPSREGPGEAVLLARAPVFKIRYTWDGDLTLGCDIGCDFCYYRWVPMSRGYIGTGRTRPIANADEMSAFLLSSKMFDEDTLLILGARGDMSMYPNEMQRFLEVFPSDNIILALHRPAADERVLRMFQDPRFRFGTTLTPGAYAAGWTPVSEEAQLFGLAMLVERGIDPDRISIEVGPLTADTLGGGLVLIRALGNLGFRHICVRGVSFGALGNSPEETKAERERLQRKRFLEREVPVAGGADGHKYYDLKNHLPDGAWERVLDVADLTGMVIHRRTYTFYRDVWGVRISKNRGNKVRISQEPTMPPGQVKKILAEYGLDATIVRNGDHYYASLPDHQVATEDLAMVIGARLDAAIIFNNYRRTTALADVRFYVENGLLDVEPFLGTDIISAIMECK